VGVDTVARLLEHTAKALLRESGLTVPEFHRCTSAVEAVEAAHKIDGPCVVKALIPVGRRGKSGAIRFCQSPVEVHSAATILLGATVGTYQVDAVLVEAQLKIVAEFYLAFRFADGKPAYRLLLSSAGGVDVESHQDRIFVMEIHPGRLPEARGYSQIWTRAGATSRMDELGEVTAELADLFVRRDLTLLEVNPLALLADGSLACVGALMSLDDNALRRQPEVAAEIVPGSDRAVRPETALEARVSTLNLDTTQRGSMRYLELEGGNIGFLCGGGGASLLLFDAVVAAGGRPANYSEFGGNPTEQRVYDLTRVVLDKPGVQGLFLAHNLTNNTQVDIVAAGVIRALRDHGARPPFPVVAREAGLQDDAARLLFERAGIACFGEETTLEDAAIEMVKSMRQAGLD
jgi:succinyl-CoA synthetase beta subunit